MLRWCYGSILVRQPSHGSGAFLGEAVRQLILIVALQPGSSWHPPRMPSAMQRRTEASNSLRNWALSRKRSSRFLLTSSDPARRSMERQ